MILQGLPNGLSMVVIGLAAIMMAGLVNLHGTETAAAYAVTLQLWNYVFFPSASIGAAVSILVSHSIGAERWDRVSQLAIRAVQFNVAAASMLVALLIPVNRYALPLFFAGDEGAIKIAQHINALASWWFIPWAAAQALAGVVRASGAANAILVLNFVAFMLFRVPFAGAMQDRWGEDVIWWSFPVSAVMLAIMTTIYYWTGWWRRARLLPATLS